MLTSPVVYLVFNRPRQTRETFAAIRAQQPSELFIVADGPRPDHPDDVERCQQVRKIVNGIDWPCKVHRNFAESNLGCKQRVVSGLDWVFSQVEQAIILEDDCLPHPDFFSYCDALLERYQHDERVMVVTGDNFQNGRKRGQASYYFSKYNHVWGWATWKRAWRKNDPDMSFWPEWKMSHSWKTQPASRIEMRYWSDIFDRMHRNEIDTWDYPWMASVWYSGGLTATPNVNLVTNIGIGPDGTHTVTEHHQPGLPTAALGQLAHPTHVKRNRTADSHVFNTHFGGAEMRKRYLLSTASWILKLPRRAVAKAVRVLIGRTAA